MTKLFLTAKHWQLFMPMVLPVLIFQFAVYNVMMDHIDDPEGALYIIGWLPLGICPFILLYYGWIWSMATGFLHRLPQHIKVNTMLFRILFFYSFIEMMLFPFFIRVMLDRALSGTSGHEIDALIGILIGVFILHIIAAFCLLYLFYFTARTMKIAELQREVVFDDYAAEFFLVWFQVVGIWILQPRVNRQYHNGQLTMDN